MLKTLRITSVIAAVLAVGLFAFPTVFGFRSDEDIERLLSSPSVIDKFRQDKGGKAGKGEGQTSPLVEQAKAFALYLNPPPPPPKRPVKPPPTPPRSEQIVEAPTPPPPPRTTPKFKVVLTSFYEARPEMSLALIDEVGKGRHWVREGTQVGHVTVERIKDGLVLAKGGQDIFELAVPMKEETSLLADSAPVSAAVGLPTTPEVTPALDSTEPSAPTQVQPDIPVRKTPPVIDAETAALAALVDKLKAAQSGAGADGTGPAKGQDERAALMEQFMSALNARESGARNSDLGRGTETSAPVTVEPVPEPEDTRISPEEADRLGDLGEALKDDRRDPDRLKARREQLMKERRERMKQRMEERMKRIKAPAE